jgi:hypothetical protein
MSLWEVPDSGRPVLAQPLLQHLHGRGEDGVGQQEADGRRHETARQETAPGRNPHGPSIGSSTPYLTRRRNVLQAAAPTAEQEQDQQHDDDDQQQGTEPHLASLRGSSAGLPVRNGG